MKISSLTLWLANADVLESYFKKKDGLPSQACLQVDVNQMNVCDLIVRIHRNGRRDGLYKDNLLLRGCTIRNTEEAVGIVIYAGTKAPFNQTLVHFE